MKHCGYDALIVTELDNYPMHDIGSSVVIIATHIIVIDLAANPIGNYIKSNVTTLG